MSVSSTTVHHHNKLIKGILILFLSIFSLLFVIQWISLSNNISDLKKNLEIDNLSFKKIKTNLIDISTLKSDSLNVALAKEDVEKINSNLNALTSEVYNERNRAETIIDKDIDRLNLYMALGIGFIAILGIFVPILVNILTNDDLKSKQEDLNNKVDIAIGKSLEIDDLKVKTDELLPKISIINLQIAIHRLFNVSSLALSKIAKNPKDSSLFIELFSDVKNAIQICKTDLIIIENSIVLKQTLMDCKELMIEEEYKFTTFGRSRNLYSELNTLSDHFVELSNCKKDEQEAKYNQLDSSFENFINKLKSLNA